MPLQPDEKTLTHETNVLNIRATFVTNYINQQIFKRYLVYQNMDNYLYLYNNKNQSVNIYLKKHQQLDNFTNALLKYDYYTTIAVVYNSSRMSVPIMVKEGDAAVVSIEDVLPYDRSGVITIYPGRSMKVHYDRLDIAQLDKLRQYLNIYTYNIPSIALRTRWSIRHVLNNLLCLSSTAMHMNNYHLIGEMKKDQDTDGLIRGTFDISLASDNLLCSTTGISSSSTSFFQSVYRQVQKITFAVSSNNFPNSVTPRSVGFYIRMTQDGELLFVGAPTSVNKRGELRVFTKVGDIYNDIANLTGQDSAPGDYFGYHFSITDDAGILVVGSPHLENLAQVSQVYVFNYNGTGYNQIQQISDPAGVTGTEFGYQIHLSSSGDTLVVASPNYNSGVGIVYIYKLFFGTFNLVNTITAPGGGRFGDMIDLTGYTLAISAPDEVQVGGTGCVYLYDITGNGPYTITQTISAPISGIVEFGKTVAFGDDTLFIGYPGISNSVVYYYNLVLGTYVFDNTKSFNSLEQLFLEHADYDDYLFVSSVDGDSAGLVDIYNYPDYVTYAFAQILKPSDFAAGQLFGKSVAVSSDAVHLVVGAPGDNIGEGAAYVFKRN